MDPPGIPFTFDAPAGLRLTGQRWGECPRQVLFLPGNGFSVACYQPALSALAGEAEIHGLNPQGLRGGEVPTCCEDWERVLEDLQAYLCYRLRPPVVLMGHSDGAMLSLWLASLQPERVRGVLLLDPLLLPPRHSSPRNTPHEQELMERTRQQAAAPEALRERGGRELCFLAFLAAGLQKAGAGAIRPAGPSWLETRIHKTHPRVKIWQGAQALRVPVAVVRGAHSPVASLETCEALVALLSTALLLTVQGEHCFPQQHPAQTAAALKVAWRFLMQAEPGEEIDL